MRKLNGITINGEYLGNSVVINGMFRAICTISPVIMRDFVTIINKIERLEDAVKIKNFNCGFNSIDIEFGNTLSKGLASLYFKLKNGEPEMTDYKLVLNGVEYGSAQNKIPATVTNPNSERQKRLRELKERKIEQQKKLNELKKQKIEELKKRAEERKAQSLSIKSRDAQNVSATESNTQNLSPEELKAKKREELLQKKREELLQKKREELLQKKKAAGQSINTDTDTNTDNLASENNSENNDISDTLPTDKKSAEVDTEKNALPGNESSQQTVTDGITENNEQIKPKESNPEELSPQTAEAKTTNISDSDNSDPLTNENNVSTENNLQMVQDDTENSITDSNFTDEDTEAELSETEYEDNPADDFGDFESEEDLEAELARLEAEVDAEMENYTDFGSEFDSEEAMLDAELNRLMAAEQQSQPGGTDMMNMYSGLAKEINEGLSQGLIQGLSQGLSEGLSQGLSQGLGALFGNTGSNAGFNQFAGSNTFDNNTADNSYSANTQPQAVAPDFGMIDNLNNDAAMSARDTYLYDENSNLEDLSDLYSDFYTESAAEQEEQNQYTTGSMPPVMEVENSEYAAMQAELNALKASLEPKKDLMSKDEFLDKQKQLEEAKEKKRRQKFKIVGSRGKINASALDDGFFVAGKKFYKWGDTKLLDF